jgi:hypothetical protein
VTNFLPSPFLSFHLLPSSSSFAAAPRHNITQREVKMWFWKPDCSSLIQVLLLTVWPQANYWISRPYQDCLIRLWKS